MVTDFWKNKKVLITGGTGFIGGALCSELSTYVKELIVFEHDNFAEISTITVRGDIANYLDVERAIYTYSPDIIFHLAAQALVGRANRSPLYTFDTNIKGTYNVLEACRRAKRDGIQIEKIVIASTDHVYGDHPEGHYTETTHLNGVYPYDMSKVCADNLTRCYLETYDMKEINVVRFGNVYGPRDTNLSRVIPGTIKSLLNGETPVIRSDGTLLREYVYIDDAVDGYIKMAEMHPNLGFHYVNFGTGSPISVLDLVNKIILLVTCDITIGPIILNRPETQKEIYSISLSSDRAYRIGWMPKISLENGLNQTIDWWKQYD